MGPIVIGDDAAVAAEVASDHNEGVRIHVKDSAGRPRLTLYVDPAKPPTMVKAEDGRGPALSLDWNQAVDDEGHLRHCPVCTNSKLFRRKAVPQMTPFALLLITAVIAMVLFGTFAVKQAIAVLAVVIVIDVLIYFLAPLKLVCYRCETEYFEVPIGRSHKRWDRNVARSSQSTTDRTTSVAGAKK